MQALRGEHNEDEWINVIRPYIMVSQNQSFEWKAPTLVSSSRLHPEKSKICPNKSLFQNYLGIKPCYCFNDFGLQRAKSLSSSFPSLMVR